VRDHLPPIGIESLHLAVLDPPSAGPAASAHLVAAYDAADPARPVPDLSYPAQEILPYAAMTTAPSAAYVVSELGSPGEEQALLVMDLGQPDGQAYEALRHVFSAALAARLQERLARR
jgi:hypothetical protein